MGTKKRAHPTRLQLRPSRFRYLGQPQPLLDNANQLLRPLYLFPRFISGNPRPNAVITYVTVFLGLNQVAVKLDRNDPLLGKFTAKGGNNGRMLGE